MGRVGAVRRHITNRAAIIASVAIGGVFAGGWGARADRAPVALDLAGTAWTVERRVATASMPWSVTPSPDGRWWYVAHVGVGKRHRDNVWRYDARTLDVRARSEFRGHAVEAALTRDGERLFVTNSRAHELLELDPLDLSVRARWTPGRVPKDLRLTPDESTAVVANWGSHGLAMIDLERPGAAPRRVRTGRHTRGVALSRGGGTGYAMAFSDDVVRAVTLAEDGPAPRTIARCDQPRHAVVAGDLLLVTCHGDGVVVAVEPDAGRVTRRLRTGPGPKTIALSPDGRLAVVANEDGNSITAIDLTAWRTATVDLPGRQPCGVAFSPDGRRLAVTLRGSHELVVLARRPEATEAPGESKGQAPRETSGTGELD